MNHGLPRHTRHVIHGQTGMVLLFCLIFLTALTLLGLSASADAILQNKLAANLQDAERAKQSALATLSWAEHWLLSLPGPAPENCAQPCVGLNIHAPGNLPAHPEFENLSWWTGQGHEAGVDPLTGDRITTISGGSIDTPVWIIEAAHAVPPSENSTTDLKVWYRILARGSGRSSTAVSVIESTLVRSWTSIESTQLPGAGASGTCPGSEPEALCGRLSWREIR
jgi:Tfp pilus assembly protein PilX